MKMNARAAKKFALQPQAGLGVVEMAISAVLTMILLLGAVRMQKAEVDSYRDNRAAAEPGDALVSLLDAIDRDLRLAGSGTLEVPGSPFPSAPVSGMAYQSIMYKRVYYNNAGGGGSASTSPETNFQTVSLTGTTVQRSDGTSTVFMANDVSALSFVWTGATRTVTVTASVTKNFPNRGPVTRTLSRTIFLRNT